VVIPNATPREEQDDKSQFSKITKNKILFSCLSALCIGNMMMQNVASFLPSYVKQRNHDWQKNGLE